MLCHDKARSTLRLFFHKQSNSHSSCISLPNKAKKQLVASRARSIRASGSYTAAAQVRGFRQISEVSVHCHSWRAAFRHAGSALSVCDWGSAPGSSRQSALREPTNVSCHGPCVRDGCAYATLSRAVARGAARGTPVALGAGRTTRDLLCNRRKKSYRTRRRLH